MMQEVSNKIDTSQPKICGGTPRDRYLNRLENISDIDITNGDKSIDYLSQEFAQELKKRFNITRKTMGDGHSTLFIGNLKVDFSSNFNAPNIDSILNTMGIKSPTNMQKELYSRDFTCNALLLSFDLKSVSDPTKHGFDDINKKLIKTCLSPEITLTTNRNRVARVIYLASKLDFDVDENIIKYVQHNPNSLNISSKKALTEKLNKAFELNPDKSIFLIKKMGLVDYLPISEKIAPYYNTLKRTAYFQGTEEPTPHKKQYKSEKAILVQPRFKEPFYRNYDAYEVPGLGDTPKLGPGAGYNEMSKYKSIADFLKAKRKHMKDKYKADDQYIEDTFSNREERISKMKTRANLISKLIKLAIDFPIDDQIQSSPILGNKGIYSDSVPIGGEDDPYLSFNDFEGKSPDQLDFGRDYTEDEHVDEDFDLDSLFNKYLNPAEPSLYGLPDGISPKEDLDAPSNENQWYGTTDSGTRPTRQCGYNTNNLTYKIEIVYRGI